MTWRMRRFAIALLALLAMGILPASAWAESFVVEDVRVEGLQRIGAGTVFNYLPVKPGDLVDDSMTPKIIRALYKTGFFKDVRLRRDGSVLIVVVQERPAISEIEFEGNKSIDDEDLKKGLQDIGLAEGRTFNESVLERIEQELRRQFYNQGKYAVELISTVTPLERNRVAIAIRIVEGDTARIKQINIVGNTAFEEDDLLDELESTSDAFWFWSKADQYSKQKLAADLERLRSYYQDRGYVKFQILSTQVSITPDKNSIFITINISEGDVYTLADVRLAGELVTEPEEFFPLIRLVRGEKFSRRAVAQSSERVSKKLADLGYAFANVNAIPEIDEKAKTVAITLFVDPGKRVYVRRLEIEGNRRTRDVVIRREFRQLEGAWFSSQALTRSRERVLRTGHFETATVETPAVPGSTDEIDIKATVKEKPSGNLLAGIGFSQGQGITFNSSISENNFQGTGKRVTLAFNTSSSNTAYQLAYVNPYYTIDGISRGFNLSYRETDFQQLDTANFVLDAGNISVTFGVPINEEDRINFGFGVEFLSMQTGGDVSTEVADFIDKYGDNYIDYLFNVSWSSDSRDSAVFPRRGAQQRASIETAIPGGDLSYVKLAYRHRRYIPLTENIIFSVNGDIAYAEPFGNISTMPPFERYYAGGPGTVRGFRSNSLGPRDSNNDPYGGNVRAVGNVELYLPAPVMEDQLRLVTFLDVGGVWDGDIGAFDGDAIRYSTGLGFNWLSPLGALTVSWAVPLNDQSGDDVENFQFSFGSQF